MELLMGILAAWGSIMLLWTLAGILFLPLRRRKDMTLTVLVRGKNSAPQLERYIKGLLWLRDLGLVWWDIVILTNALDEEARQRAGILSENEQQVAAVSADTLRDWMEE